MTTKQTLLACVALVALVALKAAHAESSFQHRDYDCGIESMSGLVGWERS